MEQFGHVIDGQEESDGATFDSVDPWTREPWATVALGGAAEADRAVTAARRAFDEGPWPRMGFAERGALIHRFADLLVEHLDGLALADTRDMGKPISDARGKDVPRAAQNFRFFADHARLATAETLPMDTGHHAYTRYEPAGVVAAIAPWNFPLMLESWKVAPALAWGNTVVLKPAEDTPARRRSWPGSRWRRASRRVCSTCCTATGPNAAGSALTEDRRVDRITFTGESNTGRAITGAAARNLTPVSLELGGKGANLVFADADLDTAVDWSIKAIFSNAGQVCLAGSRLYVERAVLDEFLARFVAAAEALADRRPEGPGHRARPARLGDALAQGARLRREPRREDPHRRARRGLGREADGRRRRARRRARSSARRCSARSSRSPRSTPRTRRSAPRTTPRSGSTR